MKMEKISFSLVSILFWTLTVLAQNGKVYDNLSMESKILDGERKFAIYLPPDYENSELMFECSDVVKNGDIPTSSEIQRKM